MVFNHSQRGIDAKRHEGAQRARPETTKPPVGDGGLIARPKGLEPLTF